MSPLRVLVCDDEPLAVSRLCSLLGRLPDVEVVGTAEEGEQALSLVIDARPDLLLLDIEMPGLDGFDVVERLNADDRSQDGSPLVAFVTAFRRFAPEAFDSGAIDFLSKPVRLGRLERTIERARRAVEGREATRRLIDLQGKLESLRGGGEPWRDAHVWISRRGETIRIDLDQVDWVAAEGAYVRLHVDGASFLHREPIGSIVAKLDPSRFVRVHRSHLVRIGHVASVRRTLHGGGELILRSDQRVPLGRSYAKDARRRIVDRDRAGTR